MINGIIMGVAFVLLVFFRGALRRQDNSGWLENSLKVIGLVSLFLGQLVRVSARGFKAEHSKNSHALLEGGPYKIVSNPMYLGILLIGFGVVLMLFNFWVVFLFLLIFAWRYLPLILSEEKKLRDVFSKTYDLYCHRVPRIMPRLSSLIKTNVKEYLQLKLAWFKKEINSIIPLLILVWLFFLWRR
jgi:protein-S-isoprenylcysteine O-methyltransferase Ste14